MNKVIYKISDGTETTSYQEALKKKEEGFTYEVIYKWEDSLFVNTKN